MLKSFQPIDIVALYLYLKQQIQSTMWLDINRYQRMDQIDEVLV
jgi:hypothetical protein